MIQVRDLFKSFGPRKVLRGLSLEVDRGEFVVIVGPNGAGKTTLLRILATVIKPDKGQVHIDGLKLPAKAPEVRRRIGFITHHHLLYDELSAEENLRFYGMMYSVPRLNERIEESLELVGLADRRNDRVRTFSRGMLQRLAIARALLHNPPLVLMDEPFTGLDQSALDGFHRLLEELLGQGHTIVMTTHQLEERLALSNRLLVLHNGTIRHQVYGKDFALGEFKRLYSELISQEANRAVKAGFA